MSNSTLLVLDGIDFSDYASRGITATLNPIATGSLARDVNGNLHDLTLPQFRKYSLEVTCADQEVPTLNSVWRGKAVDVTVLPNMGIEDTGGALSMSMMVDDWQVQRDEWGAISSWRITLLQV